MSRVWLIARHHFLKEASKRSFLIILFSMPLFVAFTVGMGYLFAQLEKESTRLGVVDEAGYLVKDLEVPDDVDVEIVALENEDAAQAALENGEIDAFYLMPADYTVTREGELVYYEAPPYDAVTYFHDWLRVNILAGQSPAVVERVLDGATVNVRATESNREFAGGAPNAGHFLPLIAALIFAFLVMTTSGYMTEVLVEEKINRTMEIVVSSISTSKMIAGKIIGAVGIAVLQLLVWVLFIVATVWLGANVLNIGWLQALEPLWADLWMMIIVAAPAYLAIAAFMTLIGTTLVDSHDAEQAGPLVFLILFLPVYLLVPIIQNPNGALSIALSLFPGTSVTTLAIRSLFSTVPVWQIALSAGIGAATAVFTIWLAGTAFRRSMLRYGQPLRLRELFRGKKAALRSVSS